MAAQGFTIREVDEDSTEAFIERVFEEDYEAKVGSGSYYEPMVFEARAQSTDETVGMVEGDYWFGGAVIHRFVVAPAWRKSGVGSLLMRHFLSHVHAVSMRTCGTPGTVSVMTFDFQAPHWYPRHGFKLDAARPWGKGSDRTAHYFSMRLSEEKHGQAPASTATFPMPQVQAQAQGAAAADGGAQAGAVVTPALGQDETITVSLLPHPLPDDQAGAMQVFFRTHFDAYSQGTVGRTAGFFRWALEAVVPDEAGDGSSSSSSDTTPTARRVGVIEGMSYWGGLVISHLCVDKEHRGKGMARALLHAALDLGKARGCALATVETMSFQCPSFYTRDGFVEDSATEGWAVPKGRVNDGQPAKLHFYYREYE